MPTELEYEQWLDAFITPSRLIALLTSVATAMAAFMLLPFSTEIAATLFAPASAWCTNGWLTPEGQCLVSTAVSLDTPLHLVPTFSTPVSPITMFAVSSYARLLLAVYTLVMIYTVMQAPGIKSAVAALVAIVAPAICFGVGMLFDANSYSLLGISLFLLTPGLPAAVYLRETYRTGRQEIFVQTISELAPQSPFPTEEEAYAEIILATEKSASQGILLFWGSLLWQRPRPWLHS